MSARLRGGRAVGVAMLLCAAGAASHAMSIRELRTLEANEKDGRAYAGYYLVGVVEGLRETADTVQRSGQKPPFCIGSKRLEPAMARALYTGELARHADQYEAEQSNLPDSECTLCQGTGIRTDEVGKTFGFDKPRDPDTGKGGCNGCAGTGRQDHPGKWYPFSVENVREFATFLRECGGFSIC